jgi:protein-tyrosine phosphatase
MNKKTTVSITQRPVHSIIFVCLGNICRSPLAEGIAKRYIQQHNLDITIQSAGTGAWHVGEAPCRNSQKIAFEHDINISYYQGSQIQAKDFEAFDLIIGLDQSNVDNLKNMGCPKEKLFKLGCFGYHCEDVPDPYFFDGFSGFDRVFNMIETCVKNLFEELKINQALA